MRFFRTVFGLLVVWTLAASSAFAAGRMLTDPAEYFPSEPPDLEGVRRQTLGYQPDLPDGVTLVERNHQTVPGAFGRPATEYQSFQQVVDGMPVEGSYVQLTLQNGKILSAEVHVFPKLRFESKSLIGPRGAHGKARAALQRSSSTPVDSSEASIKWVNGRWRRVYKVNLRGASVTAVVDRDNGEVFRMKRFHDAVSGQSTGRGVDFDPLATGSSLNTMILAHLGFAVGPTTLGYSDSSGNYSVTGTFPATLTASLGNGQFVTIIDDQGTPLSLSQVVNDGDTFNPLFNPSGAAEFPTAQVNAFHHVNLERDYILSQGLTPPGFSTPLPVHVNGTSVDVQCNAFYDPATVTLNFAADVSVTFSGGTDHCANSAYDTVIYHEFGHYLDDLYGGIHNDPLSEGGSDVIALLITQQPLLGEEFFLAGTTPPPANTFIRTANNTVQYSASTSLDPHFVGQSLSGFVWDLRNLLMTSMGASAGSAYTEFLVLPAVFAADPHNIPAAVLQVYMRDDDDADLTNGTPNQALLDQAADNHNLRPNLNPTPTPQPHSTPTPTNGGGGGGNNAQSSSGGGGCQSTGAGNAASLWPLGALLVILGYVKRRARQAIHR